MTSQTETPATDGKQQPARTGLMRPRMPAFPDFFSEMDRLWDTFPAAPWRIGRGRLMPAMDVYEKEGKLHVQAELPGLKAEDIEIEVTDEGLTISGEKKDEREVKEDNYYRAERTYGRFRRQIVLPAGADTGQVDASFKDGVLKIEVPLRAATAPHKKIEVHT